MNPRLKTIFQVALALIPIAFCIYFIKHDSVELKNSINLIKEANYWWLLLGLLFTAFYIFCLAQMYISAFKSLQIKLPFSNALVLCLKRNFASVFLPAGGVSSLVFFTSPIEKLGITKTKIHLASTIYGITGLISLIIISIPALLILMISHELNSILVIAFIAVIAFVISLIFIFRSFYKKGWLFQLINKYIPRLVLLFEEFIDQDIRIKFMIRAILFSTLIELCGVAHLFIAMKALGLHASIEIALLGYVVATLMLAISPFMKGLGAVEISLTLILVNYNIVQLSAISVTLLYRFFEFWLVLFAGMISFFYKKENLLLRIFPAFLVFMLGLVNIFSVLTPAIGSRLRIIENFLPTTAIYISNFTVIIAGIILIILSAYLMRGLKNAWLLTLFISAISVIGHLTKAIDYEEAVFGSFVIGLLFYTRKNYRVLSDRKLFKNNFAFLSAGLGFILIYGIVGLYIIDTRHFHVDFNLKQSVYYLFNTAFLFNNGLLQEHTDFARWFTDSLNILGFGFIGFLGYVVLKPSNYSHKSRDLELESVTDMIKNYGNNSLDYFKIYSDKLFYISRNADGFVSFKNAGDYAVVLEMPVSKNTESKLSLISEFDNHCLENGLKSIYYRVDAKDLPVFEKLGKKSMFLGQEGIIDIDNFTMEGGDMKPTRNMLHRLEKDGFICKKIDPPIKEGVLQKLKAVSDEWLTSFDKKESAFSGGVFNVHELKNQTIFTIENIEERVVAFANIIPDYAPAEGTYDLIRKTADAPKGVMDLLLVEMVEYFRSKNIKYLNVGLAPMSGLEKGKNIPEKTLKFAYENLKQMQHFKGLRFFKEKYASRWDDKYIVFNNDYDLIQLPFIINKVSKYIA
jgi:phosphatidylglycerol lysyltransferase